MISFRFRLGEYTRGMCVIDKREKPKTSSEIGDDLVSQGTCAKEIIHSEKSSYVEECTKILVITETPGRDALVEALFKHVWGVTRQKPWYTRVAKTLFHFLKTATSK